MVTSVRSQPLINLLLNNNIKELFDPPVVLQGLTLTVFKKTLNVVFFSTGNFMTFLKVTTVTPVNVIMSTNVIKI